MGSLYAQDLASANIVGLHARGHLALFSTICCRALPSVCVPNLWVAPGLNRRTVFTASVGCWLSCGQTEGNKRVNWQRSTYNTLFTNLQYGVCTADGTRLCIINCWCDHDDVVRKLCPALIYTSTRPPGTTAIPNNYRAVLSRIVPALSCFSGNVLQFVIPHL